MRYTFLLRTFRVLIYFKRFSWWLGARFYFVLAKIFGRGWRTGAWASYKLNYFLEKSGLRQTGNWLLRREVLQALVLVVLFFSAIPQTKLYASKDLYLPGQKTIAYNLIGSDEDYSLEEVLPEAGDLTSPPIPSWREGTVREEPGGGAEQNLIWRDRELAEPVAGGTALFKPILMPGAVVGKSRTGAVEYIVEPGDSLGTIAFQFDVSVATVLWENGLNLRSVIRPGDKLTILPASGLTHKIKKGDTLKKIAAAYGAKAEEIIRFNKLKEDGSDLIVGEKIMVPGGVRPQDRVVARVAQNYASFQRVAIPPSANYRASASGYVWPTAARTITQYFSWRHQAIDIAGPYLTPNYAAKAGTVETAQCGWNSGFGCTIVINHGGGVKTRYSHNARLLVSPGEYVQTGQTIALMGNTGKVRGRTGIHIDFRIYVNGVQVNPLGYVR